MTIAIAPSTHTARILERRLEEAARVRAPEPRAPIGAPGSNAFGSRLDRLPSRVGERGAGYKIAAPPVGAPGARPLIPREGELGTKPRTEGPKPERREPETTILERVFVPDEQITPRKARMQRTPVAGNPELQDVRFDAPLGVGGTTGKELGVRPNGEETLSFVRRMRAGEAQRLFDGADDEVLRLDPKDFASLNGGAAAFRITDPSDRSRDVTVSREHGMAVVALGEGKAARAIALDPAKDDALYQRILQERAFPAEVAGLTHPIELEAQPGGKGFEAFAASRGPEREALEEARAAAREARGEVPGASAGSEGEAPGPALDGELARQGSGAITERTLHLEKTISLVPDLEMKEGKLELGPRAVFSLDGKIREQEGAASAVLEVKGGIALVNTAKVEAKEGPLALSAGVAAGQRMTVAYTANVPASTAKAIERGELTLPNPFDPTSIPVGSSLVIKNEDFVRAEGRVARSIGAAKAGNGAYAGVSWEREEASGYSFGIQRVSPTVMRATFGPHEVVSESLKLGVSLEGKLGHHDVSLLAYGGVERQLTGQRLKVADFDLSSSAGRRAYDELRIRGVLPERNGPGVAGVHKEETISFEHKASLGAELRVDGSQSAGGAVVLGSHDARSVVSTDGDGKVRYSVFNQYHGQESTLLEYRDHDGRAELERMEIMIPKAEERCPLFAREMNGVKPQGADFTVFKLDRRALERMWQTSSGELGRAESVEDFANQLMRLVNQAGNGKYRALDAFARRPIPRPVHGPSPY